MKEDHKRIIKNENSGYKFRMETKVSFEVLYNETFL